jgi:polyisoprenoid-binding protein YceI
MRLTATHAFAALFVLAPLRTAPELLVAQPESKLWVEGTSTIKSFTCTVPEFDLKVNAEGTGTVAAVLNAQKPVKSVALTIDAAKLDCGSGTMNDHMHEAIKLDKNPAILFKLSGYDVTKDAAGVQGTVHGSLALGGAEHPVDVTAVATDAGNGALRVVGSYELALSAFDLKRPSLMFGRIKVGDKVQVKFDLVLKN